LHLPEQISLRDEEKSVRKNPIAVGKNPIENDQASLPERTARGVSESERALPRKGLERVLAVAETEVKARS
jgi:hypothetical protein